MNLTEPPKKFARCAAQAIYVVLGLSLLACGCKTTTVAPLSSAKADALTPAATVFVATPKDGNYGPERYSGSGKNVAAALAAAFMPHTSNVVTGGEFETANDALAAAKLKQCRYLALPRITHWEDRTTEWSGIPDRIEIFIQLYAVADSTEINSVKISGKSSWFTFGGDHPQDLLAAPVKKFVDSLY